MTHTITVQMTPDDFMPPFSDIVAELLADGKVLYESLRAEMPASSRGKDLTIEVVNDGTLNASATSRDDGYIIQINRGALQHIYGAAFGLCCCPGFLPSVGNAAGEMEPKIEAGGFPPMPLTEGMDVAKVLVPETESRGTIAYLLADVATYFLLYHEIGHIVGGHLEALNARSGTTASISEYSVTKRSTEDVSLLHAFECDADAFACHVSMGLLTGKAMAEEVRHLMQRQAWPPEDCAFITILTAVSMLFRLLYPTAPATIDATRGTHPHPAVRDFVVGSCALARGMARGQLSVEKVDQVLEYSVRNVEEVWAKRYLGGQALASPAVWVADIQRGVDELFAIHSKYVDLLEQHSHVPRSWHDWKWPWSGP